LPRKQGRERSSTEKREGRGREGGWNEIFKQDFALNKLVRGRSKLDLLRCDEQVVFSSYHTGKQKASAGERGEKKKEAAIHG